MWIVLPTPEVLPGWGDIGCGYKGTFFFFFYYGMKNVYLSKYMYSSFIPVLFYMMYVKVFFVVCNLLELDLVCFFTLTVLHEKLFSSKVQTTPCSKPSFIY